MDSYWAQGSTVNLIGEVGVILFFVLSGFLITYLLLAEENNYGTIDVKKFYLRRILRILPLYFLIVGLALFILPNIPLFTWPGYGKDIVYQNIGLKTLLFVLLLPNLIVSYWGIIPYASQTWSIGTEEQFYFIWPLLLKWVKKHRIVLMLVIILMYGLINQLLVSSYSDNMPFKVVLKPFWTTLRIDCMAIGGLFGILLFNKSKYILNNSIFYIALILVNVLLYNGVYFPYFIHAVFYALLFGIIIVNLAANTSLKISIEFKPLNYLGTISYGLYMYHLIGIVLAIIIARLMHSTSNFILYPLSFIITILLAAFSYKYFESFFLQFKYKLSRLESGKQTTR